MESIKDAVDCFNSDDFETSEKIAVSCLKQNIFENDAIDVLAAIFLKTGNLNFLKTANKKDLDIIRRTAVYLNKLKMYEYSMVLYKKSLEIEPKDHVGYNNLGLLYENLQNDEEAKNCYEKSLKVRPNYEAYYNLGIYYRKQKDSNSAIKYVKQALQLRPNDPQTEYSLGMLYFMESNFEEGYKHFLKRPTKGIDTLKNFWQGDVCSDKTVLVFCDYGLGDAIMYSRYFPFLKKYFGVVKVYCSKNLKLLFEDSFSGIEFLSDLTNISYDKCVLAMNLPYYLNMDFSHIPFSKGYLKADENKINFYKDNFFNNDKFKIGLFWVGGDKEKRTAKNRKIPLYMMESLFDNSRCKFYSLQIEDPYGELSDFPMIVNVGKTFKDFSDTAAAIKNLDLLISIDSSVIHLAGALGKKSYLMLPKCSEWRWFKDEKNTVWYDSVELFVQDALYNWESVVKKIKENINSF